MDPQDMNSNSPSMPNQPMQNSDGQGGVSVQNMAPVQGQQMVQTQAMAERAPVQPQMMGEQAAMQNGGMNSSMMANPMQGGAQNAQANEVPAMMGEVPAMGQGQGQVRNGVLSPEMMAHMQAQQQKRQQDERKKSKKVLAVVLVILVLVVAGAGGVWALVTQPWQKKDEVAQGDVEGNSDVSGVSDGGTVEEVGPETALDIADVMDVEKFEQMTKDEAIAFLRAGQNTGGSIPKNYVGEEVTNAVIVDGDVTVSDLRIIYSYETMEDLKREVEEKYGGWGVTADDVAEGIDYEIKEYDYYAIVTPNRAVGATSCDHGYNSDCDSLFSFKRDYINYYLEETSPHSYNDVAYLNINVQDLETIERLLRTYSLFYNYGGASSHGNIYGSSFEEQDDMFVLTVYYVGVGLNMEKLKEGSSEMEYAINLYSRQYVADKADGGLHVIRTGEDSTVNNIKSIPITQEEAASLLSR